MESKDKLDQWLDQALDQYANIEPRAGLELRVMANLDAERARLAGRRASWWPLGAASACAVIVILAWLGQPATRTRVREPQRTAQSPATSTAKSPASTTARAIKPCVGTGDSPVPEQMNCSSPRESWNRGPRRPASPLRRARVEPVVRRSPKHDQFPSARPLSEQERLLVAYVNATSPREVVNPAATAKELDDLQISRLGMANLDTPLLAPQTSATESNATN